MQFPGDESACKSEKILREMDWTDLQLGLQGMLLDPLKQNFPSANFSEFFGGL